MSAAENVSPEQFGKHVIAHDPLRYRTVTATSPSGRNMGYLMWDKPGRSAPGVDPARPTINSVRVSPQLRGKGLAGALLQHALKHEPTLQHDHALTPDGKRFAEKYPL